MSPAPWVSRGGWGSRWGSLRSAHPTLRAQGTRCRVGHTTRSPTGTFPRGQKAEGTGAVPPARSHRQDVAMGQGCGAALREGAGAGKRGCKVLRLGSALCTELKAVISANGSFAGDIQIATTPFPLQISPPPETKAPAQGRILGAASSRSRMHGTGFAAPGSESQGGEQSCLVRGADAAGHKAGGTAPPCCRIAPRPLVWGSRGAAGCGALLAFLTEKESGFLIFYFLLLLFFSLSKHRVYVS